MAASIWRAVCVIALVAAPSGLAMVTTAEATPVDRNGVAVVTDGLQRTLEEAAGDSITEVCIVSGIGWGPTSPSDDAVAKAIPRGAGSWVDPAFTLGPIDAAAKTRGLDVRWSDGSGQRVFAIDGSQRHPTVVTLVATEAAEQELWLIERIDTIGGCDGDHVPAASAS